MTHDAPESNRLSEEILPEPDARDVLGDARRTDITVGYESGRYEYREQTLSRQHLRSRKVALPVALFLLTCASTFWAGVMQWRLTGIPLYDGVISAVYTHFGDGLIYMICVLAILFAHEMGHFLATVVHGVPASLPFFIPLPISPLGTMGAVIAMDGKSADRREVFDIGIAGPLAGLVVAIPILIYGVMLIDFNHAYAGPAYDSPLLVDLLVRWLRGNPKNYVGAIAQGQLNAYYMAGWVGLLITGLNMMPVSQLDGGHVIYTLFGRSAHWLARGFIFVAILFIVFGGALNWLLMLLLVILMGTDHPPTRDDSVPLGSWRKTIGYASLVIPVLCFPPYLFILP